MNEAIIEKRNRTPNYSYEEKLHLINIISKYKNVIECKKTNSTTCRDKDIAWMKITDEFNLRLPNGIYRDKNSLKKCYENKKKMARKLALDKKKGKSYMHKSDPCVDILLDITNPKTIDYGLLNELDGDSMLEISEDGPKLEIKCEDNYEGDEMCKTRLVETEEEKVAWDHFDSADQNAPINKQLSSDESCKIRRRHKAIQPARIYRISKQYSKVINLKKEYLELQLQIAKNKEQRDVEEFELRKRSLFLDIELKELQIKRLKCTFD